MMTKFKIYGQNVSLKTFHINILRLENFIYISKVLNLKYNFYTFKMFRINTDNYSISSLRNNIKYIV